MEGRRLLRMVILVVSSLKDHLELPACLVITVTHLLLTFFMWTVCTYNMWACVVYIWCLWWKSLSSGYYTHTIGSLIHCFVDGRNERKIKSKRNTLRDPPELDQYQRIYKLIIDLWMLLLLLVLKMLVDTFTGLRSIFEWKSESTGRREWGEEVG